MKKFFKNFGKKHPARSGGPPPEGSPKLDNRSTASLVIGYDVREKELGKLHKAAWLGDVAKVQQLAKKDSSPIDKEKRTPLHLACAQGHDNVVQELLEWKAKTNIGDADARTPLMKAVECRQESCVVLLLQDRVELDSVDKDGNTALHIAAMDGSSRIVKMLCQSGASMTIKNREGLAPLHLAVREKHEEVCRTIISFRGQVDIEDNNLRTPLMYACQDGSVNLVKLFLDQGASTLHKDAKGWSADDCAVIQGHHACSQLISDHLLRQQRGSAASTPRSAAGSRSATPRGPSPFTLPPPSPTDPDSATFGLPAADAGGDESGDETLSKASAKGAGSDSWGDDTDVSLAEDKKGKEGSPFDNEEPVLEEDKGAAAARVNLAKLVGHLPSESDDGDGGRTGEGKEDSSWNGGAGITPKRSSSKSYQSDISQDDNSWAAADSPVSSRRSAVRVSFKGDQELSEVHDITATESEGESDHYTVIPDSAPGVGVKGYIPSAAPASAAVRLSSEQQRAFMEDLGLSDVDDISGFSDGGSESKPAVKPAGSGNAAAAASAAAANSDSEWDSTVKSDQPKHGILKKWGKVDEGSDWDTTEAEDVAPPGPSSPRPTAIKTVEEETKAEEVMALDAPTTIPKEGNDSLDVTPQQDLLDKPSQDSEWDSTADAATPRNIATTAIQLPPQQESDWDSTVEAVTPRAGDAPGVETSKKGADAIQPIHEEDDDDFDEVEDAVLPLSRQNSGGTGTPRVQETVEKMTPAVAPGLQHKPAMGPDEEEEEDESAWDSDGDMLPSDAAPALPLDTEVKPQASGGQQKMAAAVGSDTDDDMEKTETVSEWEVDQKRRKEEKLLAEQEEKKWKEEERLQQEQKQREEEERKRRQEEEEEEARRKEQQWKEEEIRRQQWECEEAERAERMRAEAEKALKEESLHQQADSSEEESLAHEQVDDRPPPTPENRSPLAVMKDMDPPVSHQKNSRVDIHSMTTTQTEVVIKEELKRVEEQIREESITGASSKTRVSFGAENYGSLQPLQSQGVPQPSSSTYLPGPTAQQIKQRLQIGTSPSAYHSDGMESDDSLASDIDRNEVQSSYPALLGSTQSFRPDFNMADDDVLSYTSTEFEGNDPVPSSSGPFVRDVLLNMNLSDPSTLVQVQDYMRETKRHMEQERNQRTVLENKLRLLGKEKQDLLRKLENVTETKQSLEQNKLDLEARIRSLEYNLSEEQEKKRSAELLLTKTKEQLGRKEDQFTSELEGKQRAELIKRNIELEMKAAQNTIKDLEEEKDELERQLQVQIEHGRRLQDQVNEEQSRLSFQKHQETLASSAAATSARLQDRYIEDDSGEGEDRSERDRLSTELYAVKMELERQRSRFKDEIAYMTKENEELQSRVEELKNDIKLNEEAMAHASMQYNVHLSTLRSEVSNSAAALDKEHAMREKLETEMDSVQKRLQVAVTEKDRAAHARNDLERQWQLEKQSHGRDLEHREEEVNILKENNQHLNHRIQSLETKLSSMESELHVSSTSLLERSNQLQLLRQDAERHKSAQNNFDTNYRAEKELNTKLQVKIESLQERLAQSQMEVTSLKQQVENLHTATLNASASDPHEQLSAVINTLRSDSDRTKAMLEERNSSLMEQVQHLKEELRNAENRHGTVDSELRRMHSQHAELNHKLSFAEAQLQLLQKTKEQLEQEKSQLKAELEKAAERHRLSQEKCLEAQARLADMTDRLDRAERTSQLSTQHLANTSATFTAVARSKEEMEDTVQRLQMENTRLETDLRHERERTQMLQAEVADSRKVRNSLEALCSNLKSTSAHLEEKLGEEAAGRVVMTKEAKDARQLLKQELATRSALGMKIVQLERAQKVNHSQVQQAKIEGTDAKEQKQVIEAQLIEESQKNQQLQKEVSNLKSHLKAAKKKIKDSGGGGGSGRNTSVEEGSHYAEFRQHVATEGGKMSTPRGSDGNNHHHFHHVLQQIVKERTAAADRLKKQQATDEELAAVHTSVRNLECSFQQLDSKVAIVSSQMESGTIDVEALKVELEMKYRRDLNKKLEEVNSYLETQALARDRLETSRTENETRLSTDKRRLEEENSNLKLQYEQALAQRESSEMEARRFKQLYESEMQWRLRLSDQLQLTADKAMHLKSPLLGDPKNRLYSSVGLLNKSAPSEASLNMSGLHNQGLSNKIQAELDRSIARHLEAAPHSDIVPLIRKTEDTLLSQSLTRTSKDYIDVLKRKYCVP